MDDYKDITVSLKVRTIERFEDKPSTIARIHYPDEGSIITIVKGLNVVELEHALCHEIGHLIDWYLSQNNQKLPVEIREKNADLIGGGIQLEREIRKEINRRLNEYHDEATDHETNKSDKEDI